MQCNNKALSTLMTILLTAIITAGGIYIYQNETNKNLTENLSPNTLEETQESTTNESESEEITEQNNEEETVEISEDDTENDGRYYNTTYGFTLEVPSSLGAISEDMRNQELMNGAQGMVVGLGNGIEVLVVNVADEISAMDYPATEIARNSEYIFYDASSYCGGRLGCDEEADQNDLDIQKVIKTFEMN